MKRAVRHRFPVSCNEHLEVDLSTLTIVFLSGDKDSAQKAEEPRRKAGLFKLALIIDTLSSLG